MSGGTEYDVIEITDFSGGMNVGFSPVALKNNELQLARNIIYYPLGALWFRNGYSRVINNLITGCIGIENLTLFETQSYNEIVSAAITSAGGRKFFKLGAVNWTEITGGAAFGAYVTDMVQFRDHLFFCNGVDFEYSSDCVTKSACGFLAGAGQLTGLQPQLITVSDDRLFLAIDNVIYWSEYDGWTTNPGTDLDFNVNDTLPIECSNADRRGIVAWHPFAQDKHLIVCRENDTWIIVGESGANYRRNNVSLTAGCVSQQGIAQIPNGNLVVVGNGDIYEISPNKYVSEQADITSIGGQIKSLLDGVNMTTAKAVYDARYNVVLIGYLNGTLVWHVDGRAWSVLDIPFSAAVRKLYSFDNNKIYFSFPDSTYLYEMFNGDDDDGTTIKHTVHTKEFLLQGFFDESYYRSTKFLCDTTEINPFEITFATDGRAIAKNAECDPSGFVLDQDILDVDILGGSSTQIAWAILEDEVSSGGHLFSIYVEKEDEEPLTIYGMGIEHAPVNRRREA